MTDISLASWLFLAFFDADGELLRFLLELGCVDNVIIDLHNRLCQLVGISYLVGSVGWLSTMWCAVQLQTEGPLLATGRCRLNQ